MRLGLRLTTLVIAGLLVGGCGASSSAQRVRPVSLILDFTPNAVHAGIYSALARHYDRDNGLHLNVIVPGATTDSIKLLESGRVNFAILDIHDLAIAREAGENLVAIMAIVERPLSSVVAAPAIRTPRQLQGKLVGITGVPSDTAVLRSIVAGAGGAPGRVRTITVGFNAVPDLLAGRIAAATAFWNDEGITLAAERPGFHSFRVEDYGAPAYPELVLSATTTTVRNDPALTQAVVRTLTEGYRFTLEHPSQSATELERLVSGLDPKLVNAQLNALLGAFAGPGGRIGTLDLGTLRRWAAWETRFGIVPRAPDVGSLFDRAFAGGSSSQ